ncbi:holo-ACP synthase [Acholeplasma granularum]|uniref:holo-ACP synthase n=1 Tax=Acholeplasma granularum TaxID=264635 RepID=UPI0004726139|nr:holo-ACP synthase [Acholeplasma granularum]
MIYAIGTDLVELNRIKTMGIERFKSKILNDDELREYEQINHENRKLTYLAGRFAVKESLFKCFKSGDKTANYKDFSILNDSNGAPYVISKYTDDYLCHITISHTNELAIAFVVLETKV